MCILNRKKPLLLLLGAGASVGFQLTTPDITNHLYRWSDYIEPPGNKTPAGNITLDSYFNSRKCKNIFEHIRDVLIQGQIPSQYINFENLIHCCEILNDFTIQNTTNRNLTNQRYNSLIMPFLNTPALKPIYNIPHEFGIIAQRACYKVLDYACDMCNNVHNIPLISHVLKILSKKYSIRCYSLNYDDLPLKSGIKFYTGFQNTKDINGKTFKFRHPHKNINIYVPLHGSILLSNHTINGTRCEYLWHDDRNEAKRNRNPYHSNTRSQSHQTISKAPMVTGLSKCDKIIDEPFASYVHSFRTDAFEIPDWLIIGYGCNDDHINNILKQARLYWGNNPSYNCNILNHFQFNPQDQQEDGSCMAIHGYPIHDVKLYPLLSNTFPEDLSEFIKNRERSYSFFPMRFNNISRNISISLDGLDFFKNNLIREL